MRRLPVPLLDVMLALLCLALTWAGLLASNEWANGSHAIQAVGVTIACAAVAIRRRFPFAAVAVYTGALLFMVIGGEPPQILGLSFAGVVVTYSFAAALNGTTLIAATAIFALTWLIRDFDDPHLNGGAILVDFFFFGMAFIIGRVVQRRERKVEHVSRVADDRTHDAIRQERERIARELHDVVAHGMSVMVVQADAARHGLPEDDDETRRALIEIERTGRESLREMRRLLGILRDGDEGGVAMMPQPGMKSLDALAQSVRQAGLPVDLRVSGEARPLSPGIDITAYRIVQEALTNALRHAGPARATVEVGYGDREITLRIEDTGRGSSAVPGNDGNGLIGMRERARLYGGSFEASGGPGGFVVTASLPLETPR